MSRFRNRLYARFRNGQVGPIEPPGPVPVNTVAPVITGSFVVGQTVTCSTGTWDNSPTGYAYQWRMDGVPISGATANSYLLSVAELDAYVDCRVTATNENGSAAVNATGGTVISVAPLVYVGSVADGRANAANFTIVDPASVGDTTYIYTTSRGRNPVNVVGFDLVIAGISNSLRTMLFKRTRQAGDSSTISITPTDIFDPSTVIAYTVRGGYGLVDVVGTESESSGNTATASTITVTKPGILLGLFANYTTGDITTPASGMTLRQNFAISPQHRTVLYDQVIAVPGGVGTKNTVFSSTNVKEGRLVHIY